jgi:hypothetical protein
MNRRSFRETSDLFSVSDPIGHNSEFLLPIIFVIKSPAMLPNLPMCEIPLPFSGGYFGGMPATMPRGLGVAFDFVVRNKTKPTFKISNLSDEAILVFNLDDALKLSPEPPPPIPNCAEVVASLFSVGDP